MKYTPQQYQTGAFNLLRIEKIMIQAALKVSKNKKEAAKRLGITFNSLAQRIYKHDIKE
jgi:transcriptional regulator with PAS, ATPase and Fis domain